jgi:hypothetical protein
MEEPGDDCQAPLFTLWRADSADKNELARFHKTACSQTIQIYTAREVGTIELDLVVPRFHVAVHE